MKKGKTRITIIALVLIIVATSTLGVLQYINAKELEANIEKLEQQIDIQKSTINSLEEEMDNLENNFVMITNVSSKTYHTGTCYDSIRAKYVTKKIYYIDKEGALELGYKKCSDCD